MELEEALELGLNGHAVLFVGAGFSVGAINRNGQRLKTGRELADHLASFVDLPRSTSLEDAAEEFTSFYGEDDLIEVIKDEFTVSEITAAHTQLASIPWRRIYTTNYDDVLEAAYSRLNRSLKPMTLSADARSRPNRAVPGTQCIHLNGFVELLNRQTIGSELKLTDSSYLTASVSESPWAVLFRQDLKLARAVFFVGYSLADLDIRRLIFESPELSQKCFFVLGEHPEEATRRRASRFGTILPMDTTAFAESLSAKAAQYVPQEPEAHIGYSIKQFAAPEGPFAFSDQSIFDLLLLGHLKPDLVWSSLHEGEPYICERLGTQRVIDSVSSGARVVVVHSELGNGKTCFLEAVKCRALESGYDVYTVSVRSEDIFRELDQIVTSAVKTLLFVEEYPDWIDVIEHFSLNANSNISLVLSARNPVHDVMIDRVCQVLGRTDIPEFSTDLLTRQELGWISDFFNRYGLWGEKAAWSTNRKLGYLAGKCRSQFGSILMDLFESPQIAHRFERILNGLSGRRDYYEVLISVMILAVVQRSSSIDLMIDIWRNAVMETQFKRNEAVREFFDFPTGEIKLRSAPAAQFILKHVADANLTVDTLIKMARAFNMGARFSDTHRSLLRELMRFSTLQGLLPERQRRPAIIRYYEGIKNLDRCRRNPQFWLQYAIACLTLEELDRAEAYFDTAYSFASAGDYGTIQIDNHYARFLLVRATKMPDPDTCMESFRQARLIIERQIKDDRMHYPYRVARLYLDFYEVFESRLDEARSNEIFQAAAFVSDRIQSLPKERRDQRSVVECSDDMAKIIAKKEQTLLEEHQRLGGDSVS